MGGYSFHTSEIGVAGVESSQLPRVLKLRPKFCVAGEPNGMDEALDASSKAATGVRSSAAYRLLSLNT